MRWFGREEDRGQRPMLSLPRLPFKVPIFNQCHTCPRSHEVLQPGGETPNQLAHRNDFRQQQAGARCYH